MHTKLLRKVDVNLDKQFKSGFVTIIGRPNVGKSTILNRFAGEKIAIISDKPQTTRNKIQCILTGENYQIIFIDTPGMHKPKNKLGEFMVNTAKETFSEVDIVLFVVEPDSEVGIGDRYIIDQLILTKTPVILIINKIDAVKHPDVLKTIDIYRDMCDFKAIIPISALKNDGLDQIVSEVTRLLPEGPKYYPDDELTDQPEKQIVSEMIREKILYLTHDEVPHGTAVEVTSMKKRKGKDIIDIQATIYCEKETHKGIIIGKKGSMLKKIGEQSRIDIEKFLETQIYLELWIKIKEDWRNSENILKNLGYQ